MKKKPVKNIQTRLALGVLQEAAMWAGLSKRHGLTVGGFNLLLSTWEWKGDVAYPVNDLTWMIVQLLMNCLEVH